VHRLGSTCNHVAALLFKIDYAWQQGLTSGSPKKCMSIDNKWIVPSLKYAEPLQAKKMVVKKPRYKKSSTRVE